MRGCTHSRRRRRAGRPCEAPRAPRSSLRRRVPSPVLPLISPSLPPPICPPRSAPKAPAGDSPLDSASAAAAKPKAAAKGLPTDAAPKGPPPKGSWRGGFLLTAPDGVVVAVGPEPNLEGTIFDFRTAEMKKTYPPPPPVGPPIKVTIENRPIDVTVDEPAGAAGAAPKAAPKAPLPKPAAAAPKA
jgi:hypothetical protein